VLNHKTKLITPYPQKYPVTQNYPVTRIIL